MLFIVVRVCRIYLKQDSLLQTWLFLHVLSGSVTHCARLQTVSSWLHKAEKTNELWQYVHRRLAKNTWLIGSYMLNAHVGQVHMYRTGADTSTLRTYLGLSWYFEALVHGKAGLVEVVHYLLVQLIAGRVLLLGLWRAHDNSIKCLHRDVVK